MNKGWPSKDLIALNMFRFIFLLFLFYLPFAKAQDCKNITQPRIEVPLSIKHDVCKSMESFFAVKREKFYEIYSDKLYLEDKELHIFHPKNTLIKHSLYFNSGKDIYKTSYHLDHYGFRNQKNLELNEGRQFLALFGGSLTFGIGVQEDQTLSSLINSFSSKFHAYNFGVGGTGIHHAKRVIEVAPLKEIIKEEKGIGLYIFHQDHINRVVGKGIWSRIFTIMPYYEYQDGVLSYRGNFKENRKFTTSFYSFLNRYFNVTSIPFFWEDDTRLACELIQSSKESFLKKFPQSRFLVAFHPQFSVFHEKKKALFEKCLKEKKITYKQFPEPTGEGKLMYEDMHPTVISNKHIAGSFLSWLESIEL